MARFSVFLSNKAEKGLMKVEANFKNRIKAAVDHLEENPVPSNEFDVVKLTGSESNYRIKIARYRILYNVQWKEHKIKVYSIGSRGCSTYK